MAHKTLYIDIDEEITSIIDRFKKVEARELIIVAPKNAMLLQSIINLRLLKKEADRQKKKLLIITQDKVGKKLIEKAGILVQSKPGKDVYLDAEPEERPYEPMFTDEASEIKEELIKEGQEREIGSSSYFDRPVKPKKSEIKKELSAKPVPRRRDEKKSAMTVQKFEETAGIETGVQGIQEISDKPAGSWLVNMSDIIISRKAPKRNKDGKKSPVQKEPEPDLIIKEERYYLDKEQGKAKVSQVSIKKAEKFFRGNRRKEKDFERAKVGHGAKKYFIFFAGVFILLALLAAAYFFLPKAKLDIRVKNQEKSVLLDLVAGESGSGGSDLPIYLEQIEEETSKEFEATGTKSGGAKANGQVVIYNEFSSEDQPLVATTRLETSDGKIFRITESTVVPGLTKVGEDIKPGAIEVEVVADQAGEAYNIDPAEFRITGFKNNQDKFGKFYAKSAKAMTGGGAGEGRVVTAQNLAAAKDKVAADAKKIASEALRSKIAADRKIFDDTVKVEVLSVTPSDPAGSEKEKFTLTAKMRASALSFSEADVKLLMRDNLEKSGVNGPEISLNKSITYTLASFDLQQKTMKFQAKTDAKISPDFDIEDFKEGIFGKTATEAQAYAKNFPAIEKMDISFWPFFLSRLPMNEHRIVIDAK